MGFFDRFGAGGGNVGIQLQNPSCAPGGTLAGNITFTGGKRPQNVTALKLSVICTMQQPTKPGAPANAPQTMAVVPEFAVSGAFTVQPQQPVSFPFQVTLPPNAAPTMQGAVDYSLRASADISGEIDPGANTPIMVIGGAPMATPGGFVGAVAGGYAQGGNAQGGYPQGGYPQGDKYEKAPMAKDMPKGFDAKGQAYGGYDPKAQAAYDAKMQAAYDPKIQGYDPNAQNYGGYDPKAQAYGGYDPKAQAYDPKMQGYDPKGAAVGGLYVGAHCQAPWSNGQYYGGTLVQTDGANWLVQWDDGSQPMWVDGSQIVMG